MHPHGCLLVNKETALPWKTGLAERLFCLLCLLQWMFATHRSYDDALALLGPNSMRAYRHLRMFKVRNAGESRQAEHAAKSPSSCCIPLKFSSEFPPSLCAIRRAGERHHISRAAAIFGGDGLAWLTPALKEAMGCDTGACAADDGARLFIALLRRLPSAMCL